MLFFLSYTGTKIKWFVNYILDFFNLIFFRNIFWSYVFANIELAGAKSLRILQSPQ